MPPLLRWLLNLGPTNPIAVRLVQNGSRRTRHMYIRSAYLAVLILVLLWSLLAVGSGYWDYRQLASSGARSFAFVAYLQIALICVLAPVFMAGAIAQEASPRTWEVLLTTPLSALQIVLGNLAGRLFFVIALLMASLPLFALTQYFGGVPGSSVFASYAIAVCAAVLVGSIAISLSVSRLAGRRAVFSFYVTVVSYLAATMGIDAWMRETGRGSGPVGDGVTWMTALNPFLALRALLNPTGYPRATPEPGVAGSGLEAWFLQHPVTTWCVLCLVVSGALIVLSTVTVRLGGLGALSGRSEGGVPLHRRIFKLGRAGSEHRPPRAVWTNPIAWREAAARNSTPGRILARWLFIGLGAAMGVALVVLLHTSALAPTDFQIALLTVVGGELGVTTLVAINMSATAISREREDGTLDLLLTTPITPTQYLSGKLRGLIAYLLPMLAVPIGTLALAGLYVMSGGLGSGIVEFNDVPASSRFMAAVSRPIVLPEAGLVAALVVVPFMAMCVMIGLQWSLKSRGTLSSVVATVGVVAVVAGVVGLCGFQSGREFAVIGPFVAGLSPASTLFCVVEPAVGMSMTVSDGSTGGLTTARLALAVGAAVSAVPYLLVVYGVRSSMVRGFDTTVRRLAGIR